MKIMTSVEAQNRFGELLDTAQREPVMITRRGRPMAFLVSPADMQELIQGRDRRAAAVKAYDAFRARAAGNASASAKKLKDADVKRMVNALR